MKVGNGQYIKAERKEDVLIDTPSSTKLVSNVLLVLEIYKNLLSIAQFLEKGYFVVFKNKECLINDPSGSKIMLVATTDRSFVFYWNKETVSAYTTTIDKSKLWQRRMCHVNYRSLLQLSKEDLVENFKKNS